LCLNVVVMVSVVVVRRQCGGGGDDAGKMVMPLLERHLSRRSREGDRRDRRDGALVGDYGGGDGFDDGDGDQ
jgi:hypothetical protein